MQRSGPSSQAIVIDANLAVWAAVPVLTGPGIDVTARFAGWARAGIRLVAPILWRAECTTAIRRAVYFRVLSAERGRIALSDLLALEVEQYALTDSLCLAAYDWAGRLQQLRAYDAFYLALADQLQTEFWTADKRLANGARQIGMGQTRWIGEP